MNRAKVWFVTGASRGFGSEIVKAVLAYGEKVVAAVRKEPEPVSKQFDLMVSFSFIDTDVR
jgi:NAD(P)-dependent dehydrogenase (short-subunit alcohol dehydrogenase family)